jgi:hypothetical protein
MRVAYDYGFGPRVPGMHQSLPGQKTETEKVLVIRLTENEESDSDVPRTAIASGEGLAVPGTDYVLRTSDSAAERDAEVRAHERAHLYALGGAAATGIKLETRRGPDGQRFVVGGSIKADLSPVPGDPQATLDKAQQVIRAAYAPGNPSAADMRVAADAYRMAQDAKRDLKEQQWYA